MQPLLGKESRTWVQETDDYLEKGHSPKRTESVEHSTLRLLFEPSIIAIMVSCIMIALKEFLSLILTDTDLWLLIAAPVVGTFVGYRSWIVTQRKLLDGSEKTRKLLIELAMMFVLIKGTVLLNLTGPELLNLVRSWGNKPLSFFDTISMVAFSFTFVAWLVGMITARDLTAIRDPDMYAGERGPIQRLFRRFLIGGIVLLFATMLSRISFEDIVLQQYDRVSGPKITILLYFILGLFMLGQLRLARMSSLWQRQDVTIGRMLRKRWLRYSLILIAGISLIALFLPTQYVVSLMDIIRWIFIVIGFIFTLLYIIVITPFMWLYSLFLGDSGQEDFELSPMLRPEASPSPPTEAAPSWLQTVQSIVFWGIGLVLLIYIIHSYVRDHPDLLSALRKVKVFQLITRTWQAIRQWWRKTFQRLRKGQEDLLAPKFADGTYRVAAPTGQQNNPAGRNAILKAYYATLDRARKRGISRRSSQTPSEYQPRLEQATEQPQAVSALTRLFLKAHYSLGDVSDSDVTASRKHARTLQKALRQRKSPDRQNKTSPEE